MNWYPSNLQRWPRFIFCIIINSYILNMLICVKWLWSSYPISRLVGITSSWVLCTYAVTPAVFHGFLAFWYDMSRSLCTLPTHDLEWAISQISPEYFYWGTLEGSFFYYYYFLFIFLILILYCYSITVVCLFSPSLHPTPAEPPPSPTSTLPLDIVHVSFMVVPVIPFPHCPLPIPPWPLLDCS